MIRLRPYKAIDATQVVSWIKDEVTFKMWSADRYDHYPITAQDINDHYESFSSDEGFFQMTAFNESGVVGHIMMRFIDEEKSVIRFGFIIVDDTKRGQGIGKDMITLAIHYAYDILKVESITLGVFLNNKGAYHCYQTLGFVDTHQHTYEFFNEEWICQEMKHVR